MSSSSIAKESSRQRSNDAGRSQGRELQASLSRLDWKFLYKQKSGFPFVENVKAAVREKYAPDYILIDLELG